MKISQPLKSTLTPVGVLGQRSTSFRIPSLSVSARIEITNAFSKDKPLHQWRVF